jgi:uncharacterized protein YdeI (YjbR/CyaY-like superfamily)
MPKEVTAALGTKGRVSVKLTIGSKAFRTSIFPDGKGGHHAMFNRVMQAAAGAEAGDVVTVILEPDTKKRTVSVPADLKRALAKDSKARTFYAGLSWSCRKEYADYVAEAKRPETRERRVAQSLAMLKKGRKRVKM